jgi:hypothetical protein
MHHLMRAPHMFLTDWAGRTALPAPVATRQLPIVGLTLDA